MSVDLRAAVVTDPGLIRSNNEDTALVGRHVLAVADGMGGLPAGELASAIMIEVLEQLDDEAGDREYGDEEALDALHAAVEEANDRVAAAAEDDPDRLGMGTTITAFMRGNSALAFVHVGDSRAYLFRDGELSQITKDDTYVQMLVDNGELAQEDARMHPQRAIVTQAVQGGAMVPHRFLFHAEPGDRVLLCSDGLSDYVTDETIAHALTVEPEPLGCAALLVKLTLATGAPDNVTVVVAEITAT